MLVSSCPRGIDWLRGNVQALPMMTRGPGVAGNRRHRRSLRGTTSPQSGRLGNQHAGVGLREARARKERTYPELAGEGGRARLVVLPDEVGGRWSSETQDFLCALAKAKAQSAPPLLQSKVRSAWLRRWCRILACTAAKAFASSLLDSGASAGVDGDTPTTQQVLCDSRYDL